MGLALGITTQTVQYRCKPIDKQYDPNYLAVPHGDKQLFQKPVKLIR